MNKKLVWLVTLFFIAAGTFVEAQQGKVYRVGVIHQGGPYYTVSDGLRDGLRELGLEEGKHFVLEIRDMKGDLKAVEGAAKNLVQEKVNLLYTVASSVTWAAKGVTTDIPIVFCVGSDPVGQGLVESMARPGGRLTGVSYRVVELTAKRLEILKEIVPKLRRVMIFYSPGNRASTDAAQSGREEAQRLRIKFFEVHVTSIEELRNALQRLKTGEGDAYLNTADAMVISQTQLIIDSSKTKKLPTMFQEETLVAQGGLVSYGLSYHEAGRMSAKYVQRILTGTNPKDLPVERLHKFHLVFNLRTAREIGLTIPPVVMMRAEKVIKEAPG
jgi:putative ABC transport system substrate-binding protein